jgi:hypothetical protein
VRDFRIAVAGHVRAGNQALRRCVSTACNPYRRARSP